MRRLTLLILLALPLNLTAAEIKPFTAQYDIRFSGLSGEAVTSLVRNANGIFVLENRVSAKGLARLIRSGDAVDRSEFVIENDNLVPISFESDDGSRKNKRGNTITFDWKEHSASTEYKGEIQTLKLEAGTLDRQLMQLAMMSDLTDGQTEVTYNVVDRMDIKIYSIAVVAEERIEVPAGNYDVVRVERINPGSSRSTIFWCAPSLDYLTIKMEQLKDGKSIGTMSLTEIS